MIKIFCLCAVLALACSCASQQPSLRDRTMAALKTTVLPDTEFRQTPVHEVFSALCQDALLQRRSTGSWSPHSADVVCVRDVSGHPPIDFSVTNMTALQAITALTSIHGIENHVTDGGMPH